MAQMLSEYQAREEFQSSLSFSSYTREESLWDPVVWVNPAQPPSVSRCAPRSRSPVSLIVLPKTLLVQVGTLTPCPPPIPRLVRLFSFFEHVRRSERKETNEEPPPCWW